MPTQTESPPNPSTAIPRKLINVYLDYAQLAEVTNYQHAAQHATRLAAIRELLHIGLETVRARRDSATKGNHG